MQLLEVAAGVFAEVGYGAATFEDIAARAGVTRPLLYTYFDSVDEVYLECHRRARDEMQASIFSAVAAAGAEPVNQLRAALRGYFAYMDSHPARYALLYGPGAAGGPLAELTSEMRFETAEQLGALVRAAAPSLPASEAIAYTHIASGAAEQLAKWWRRHPGTSLDEVLDLVMHGLWDGLGTVIRGAAD